MDLANDLATVLRSIPPHTVADKLSYFDEASEQMNISGDLFFSLHSPQWDNIFVGLEVVGKFLEVAEMFPFRDEK